MGKAKPYKDNNEKIFRATPLWLYLITGYRKTERDIWRAGFGARKYVVRYWIFWVFKVYEDCRVFGKSYW